MKKLYEWQQLAARAWWVNKFSGVIQAVTGSGKTMVALAIIEKFLERNPGTRVVIAVPTTPLLDQWSRLLKKELEIHTDDIGAYWADAKDLTSPFIITTYISGGANAEKFRDMAPNSILIADECHRSASEVHSKLLELPWKARLGLSATADRQDGLHSIMYAALGNLVYDYGYEQAIKDKVISPYICYNVGFNLTQPEMTEYTNLSSRMLALRNNELRGVDIYANKSLLGMRRAFATEIDSGSNLNTATNSLMNYYCKNPYLRDYHILATKRFGLVQLATNRNAVVRMILRELVGADSKTFLFHQFVPSIAELAESNLSPHMAMLYHSGMTMKNRREVLNQFEEGEINLVLSCRALDEGIDIPAADVGIIAGSFSSQRQAIQRAGRILRFQPDKKASIYTIYAKDTVEAFKLHSPLYENPEKTVSIDYPTT